jgi:PKD repeat protein
MRTIIHSVITVVLAATVAACTMNEQQAPPLTGPSEFGTSLTVRVTPDVLQLDGMSQATVTVKAFNENGQPKQGQNLRADILVNGQVVDFGRLSQRSVTTGPDGQAVLTYTAPAVNADSEAVIEIAFSTIGDNHMNSTGRVAAIRLVPTGIRIPPSDLVPRFTFSPTNPLEVQTVLFDASTSSGSIAQYRWDFGDGTATTTDETITHAFATAGVYHVRLTLVDPAGRTASTTQTVTVGQAQAPTASFIFSPATPQPGDTVFFNASGSTAAAGRRIVAYHWDFNDGGPTASGATTQRRFTQARTYTGTLTVTDDAGRTHVLSREIEVAFPDDDGGQPSH